MRGKLLGACLLVLAVAPAPAAEALIAVAANFAEPMERLERDFERESGHELTVTVGSTGKLYAQIVHGAPFDVLLAADQQWPRRLEEAGLAVPGSRGTYALGRLALWSADPARVGADGASLLRNGAFRSLAIANPELAPYGAAAREVLKELEVWDRMRERIVMGENVGQTHAMVATGNADLGLVALSSVGRRGSHWPVPQALHAPIRQDAVLLVRAADNAAARSFLRFLRDHAAQ